MIVFLPFERLVNFSDFKILGPIDTEWDCTYVATHPSQNGSGLTLENFRAKDLNSLKQEFLTDRSMDHLWGSVFSDTQLIYILKSDKYNFLYVGISERGLSNGIFGTNGRLAHHVRKIFAMASGSGTNHTKGWRSHAIERYRNIRTVYGGQQIHDCTLLALDIQISFGFFENKEKFARDHEGYVLCAAFEKYYGTEKLLHVTNTGAMNYTPIQVRFL